MMSDSKDLLRMLNLCESEVEKLFLLAAYENIEGLVPQYTVLRYRIDFAIPDKMIAIEIDGHEFHKTKEQRTNDAQREREIKLELPANWTVIRFTGSEIFQNATLCVDEVLQFMQKTSPYSITSINKPKIQCETDNCDADVWYNKGVKLFGLYKDEEAIKCFDEATRLNPKYAAEPISKGTVFDGQGKHNDAIKFYEEATRLNPNLADAWIYYGVALCRQEKYDEAINAYDEAIKLNPKKEVAWSNKRHTLFEKGKTLYEHKKYDQAIVTYDQAIEAIKLSLWTAPLMMDK